MSIGPWQLLLILLIILLLFGAGRLPNVMSDLGKGLKSFKSSIKEDEGKVKKSEKRKK